MHLRHAVSSSFTASASRPWVSTMPPSATSSRSSTSPTSSRSFVHRISPSVDVGRRITTLPRALVGPSGCSPRRPTGVVSQRWEPPAKPGRFATLVPCPARVNASLEHNESLLLRSPTPSNQRRPGVGGAAGESVANVSRFLDLQFAGGDVGVSQTAGGPAESGWSRQSSCGYDDESCAPQVRQYRFPTRLPVSPQCAHTRASCPRAASDSRQEEKAADEQKSAAKRKKLSPHLGPPQSPRLVGHFRRAAPIRLPPAERGAAPHPPDPQPSTPEPRSPGADRHPRPACGRRPLPRPCRAARPPGRTSRSTVAS